MSGYLIEFFESYVSDDLVPFGLSKNSLPKFRFVYAKSYEEALTTLKQHLYCEYNLSPNQMWIFEDRTIYS